MKKPHPLKGRKRSPESIEKARATRAARKEQKAVAHLNGAHNARDASVYLRHALEKWPSEKKRGISKLYVELALATLEGKS